MIPALFYSNLQQIMKKYISEMKSLKWFMLLILTLLVMTYSVYLVFGEKTITSLVREDGFFEYGTSIMFLATSVIFLRLFLRTRYASALILSGLFFFAFGEEISWGQRIFDFETPEAILKVNVQKEFNIHNIVYFNSEDMSGQSKHGFYRLFEINNLAKIFCVLFGIFLPLLVFHLPFVSRLSKLFKIPVPPVSIGIFFILNWISMKYVYWYLLPAGHGRYYYDGPEVLYEFLVSAIFFTIACYIFREKEVPLGWDVKQVLID